MVAWWNPLTSGAVRAILPEVGHLQDRLVGERERLEDGVHRISADLHGYVGGHVAAIEIYTDGHRAGRQTLDHGHRASPRRRRAIHHHILHRGCVSGGDTAVGVVADPRERGVADAGSD